jgi:hypothetical protein
MFQLLFSFFWFLFFRRQGFWIVCKLRKLLFGIVEIERLIELVETTNDCAGTIAFQPNLHYVKEKTINFCAIY